MSFQSEETEASRASDSMVISLRNENMSFGFFSENWVNHPNRNDLLTLRKPNIEFSLSGQRGCPHSNLSYFCSVHVKMYSQRNEQRLGMGWPIYVLSECFRNWLIGFI